MKESNKMIAEFEKSIHAQSLEKLQQKELEIEEMKKIISNADIAKQAFDSKLNKLRKTLKESFDN
jgi:phage-related minor tail protein